MKVNGRTYKRNINGKFNQEIVLGQYPWGIYVMIENEAIGHKNKQFLDRRFKFTKKETTHEAIVRRIEKYYRLTEKDHVVGT